MMTVSPVFVFEDILATCVPANAKNRKDIVPTSSPITATVWPLLVGGKRRKSVLKGPDVAVGASVFMFAVWSGSPKSKAGPDDSRKDMQKRRGNETKERMSFVPIK